MSITNPQTKLQNFSVETIRNLLQTDNKGIAKLCAQVSLMPKKDAQGRTYFTGDDVEILRRIKGINEQRAKTVKRASQTPSESQMTEPPTKAYATVPMKQRASHSVQNQIQARSQATTAAAINRICSSLTSMENSITGKISELIDKKLDEKLDGMDEVVVELVRCKTENETLRYKMNELNKEVYNLKNELSRYQSFGFGLYVKRNGDSTLL